MNYELHSAWGWGWGELKTSLNLENVWITKQGCSHEVTDQSYFYLTFPPLSADCRHGPNHSFSFLFFTLIFILTSALRSSKVCEQTTAPKSANQLNG